jgi:hypothetical protein
LKSLEKTFGKPLSELRAIFGTGSLDLRGQQLPAYPTPVYQGDAGINALGLVPHVQPNQFPAEVHIPFDSVSERILRYRSHDALTTIEGQLSSTAGTGARQSCDKSPGVRGRTHRHPIAVASRRRVN